MKVFVSWSGKLSKKVAFLLKDWIESKLLPDHAVVFVSALDIEYGKEWMKHIKGELIAADMAIICLTKDNLSAPWLNFEAGSIFLGEGRDREIATILVDVTEDSLKGPLELFQALELNEDSLARLAQQLRRKAEPTRIPNVHFDAVLRQTIPDLVRTTKEMREAVDRRYSPCGSNTFPQHIRLVKNGQVFLGAPMASLPAKRYAEVRHHMLSIRAAILERSGASEVYYPALNISRPEEFDGKEKAIVEDFKVLKESEHYIFVYPERVASSILLEMGYAIALCKNTIIFTRDRKHLPFMLQQSDKAIANVRIYEIKKMEEIVEIVVRNGPALLKRGDHE